MLGHRTLAVKDYFDILKRHYLLILSCMVLLFGACLGVSYVLNPIYESQTLILIEHQRVPEDYVKPIVAEDLDARLASMKEQIMSRSRLEPIINRYNLFAGNKVTLEDRIEMTRKAINITQIHSETSHGGMPGFFVAFDARDARTAQLVCGEITSLFVSANLSAQEQSAQGTTDFLRQQLDDAKRALDEQDAKLATFQEKYLGRLPDETSSNSNTLQALTSQLDATTQSINQMQQNETFLQTSIAQATHDQKGGETPAEIDERQKELQSLIEQKRQLETQYTADYPDVIAISRKIADLQAEMSRPSAAPAVKGAPVVVPHGDLQQLRQLQAQLRAVQQSLASARQEQNSLRQRIHVYEARIEQSPMIEQEYKQLTRDHDTALQFYNSLLNKMNESSMAAALQLRQQGEQFTVMDPPNLPNSPKFPNHRLFAAAGLMAGLVLGIGIAVLLEFRDTSLRSEADIWELTNLSTLAVISHIESLPGTKDLRKDRKKLRKGKLLQEAPEN